MKPLRQAKKSTVSSTEELPLGVVGFGVIEFLG
jgi:hypothetical protein